MKKPEDYTINARFVLIVDKNIKAESMEDALAKARELPVFDFVTNYNVIMDWQDFELIGVMK